MLVGEDEGVHLYSSLHELFHLFHAVVVWLFSWAWLPVVVGRLLGAVDAVVAVVVAEAVYVH